MLVQPSDRLITIIGGSGFVGRHIVRALARRGYRIRVACRRPDLAGHLQPLGNTGQIMPVQANVRYPATLPQPSGADSAYLSRMLSQLNHSVGGGRSPRVLCHTQACCCPPPLRLRLRATQENQRLTVVGSLVR